MIAVARERWPAGEFHVGDVAVRHLAAQGADCVKICTAARRSQTPGRQVELECLK
jgi:hypothetical protein